MDLKVLKYGEYEMAWYYEIAKNFPKLLINMVFFTGGFTLQKIIDQKNTLYQYSHVWVVKIDHNYSSSSRTKTAHQYNPRIFSGSAPSVF